MVAAGARPFLSPAVALVGPTELSQEATPGHAEQTRPSAPDTPRPDDASCNEGLEAVKVPAVSPALLQANRQPTAGQTLGTWLGLQTLRQTLEVLVEFLDLLP